MNIHRIKTVLVICGLLIALQPAHVAAADPSTLFTQTGSDPTFQELQKKGKLKKGGNIKSGIPSAKIKVNNQLVETTPEARHPIPRDIKLHTLLSSTIPRAEFRQWARWYQEDGNTQVFRLFKDEVNLRNERKLAARVEAFSQLNWAESKNVWHEWSGVVTAIKPCGSIFQVKADIEGPAVMIHMNKDGIVRLVRRRGEDVTIARDMIGKPFHLRVRDNGRDYEVFYNEKKVGDGSYERPQGRNDFRWGLYVGDKPVNQDSMILFSGVTITTKSGQ